MTKWQFGYVEKGSENVKMLPASAEQQTLFAAVPELFNIDLVIVPLSQIPPEFESSEMSDGDSIRRNLESTQIDDGSDKQQTFEPDGQLQSNSA